MAQAKPSILHLGEFIDALAALRRECVLVVMDPEEKVCVLDGTLLWCSFPVLRDHGLIEEVDNAEGFPTLRYFRLSEAGIDFADRAITAWMARAWHERLALRLFG